MSDRGLSAIRATAAPVGDFPLFTILVYVADEYPAFEAGAGTLQTSVVCLYGVVVILGGWVRVGCARLCGVHSSVPILSVGRAPGCATTCGAIPLCDILIIRVHLPKIYHQRNLSGIIMLVHDGYEGADYNAR